MIDPRTKIEIKNESIARQSVEKYLFKKPTAISISKKSGTEVSSEAVRRLVS